jgi:beta-glucosidase/6-phospho-beta-glucosidase/beta-galactosidase
MYHKYPEDFAMMKQMGIKHYRYTQQQQQQQQRQYSTHQEILTATVTCH